MSVITEPRVEHDGAPSMRDLRQEYQSALTALAELNAAGDSMDLDSLLRRIAKRACEVLQIRRCSIYLRDDPREVFVGRVAHPRHEIEETVRGLTLGGPTDHITRELVQSAQPLVIRDAYSDPRAARAAIRAWKLRSLLGIPIVTDGKVSGLLIFDNGSEIHPYTPSDITVAAAMAAMAGNAIVHARVAEQLRSKLETSGRQNQLLRRTMTAEHHLSAALLGGGGASAIVELVAQLTGKPTALYDTDGKAVAKAGVLEMDVRLFEDHRGETPGAIFPDAVAGSCVSIAPRLIDGIRHRHIAAPIDVSSQRWGWLLVMEHPSRFTGFDEFLTRRAATYLALELGGRRQVTVSTSDARETLARQLLRGTEDDEDMRRNAEYLGISLQAPRVVAYVTRRRPSADAAAVDTERLLSELRKRVSGELLAMSAADGVALVIDVSAGEPARPELRRIKAALGAVCAQLESDHDELVTGLSGVCREPAAVAGAYREAREVARCVGSFADASSYRILTADDLGPARLLISNVNSEVAVRFVDDSVGPLLGGGAATDELLRTLEAFYETGRSVRLSSERLGVHENTIRYRLARVEALTGFDVGGDADDQLTVQVALLVLRLQGHSVLRRFDSESVQADEPARELAVVAA